VKGKPVGVELHPVATVPAIRVIVGLVDQPKQNAVVVGLEQSDRDIAVHEVVELAQPLRQQRLGAGKYLRLAFDVDPYELDVGTQVCAVTVKWCK
jgi:hypothetical protein